MSASDPLELSEDRDEASERSEEPESEPNMPRGGESSEGRRTLCTRPGCLR